MAQKDPLGDLQLQPVRLDPGLVENAADSVDEAGVAELVRGDVDGDADVMSGGKQRCDVGARPIQQPTRGAIAD